MTSPTDGTESVAWARDQLGLGPTDGYDMALQNYRARMRAVHPDLSGEDGTEAGLLNQAISLLRGARAAAHAGDPTVAIRLPAKDAFETLAAAATTLGDVITTEPESGYICCAVRLPDESLALLDIEFDKIVQNVLFTLESDDPAVAPNLRGLVAKLQSRIDQS